MRGGGELAGFGPVQPTNHLSKATSTTPLTHAPSNPGHNAYHGMHYAEVIEQVAIRGVRPPIPPSTPPELAALMESCWQADPTKRPGFDALVTCFELLLVRWAEAQSAGGEALQARRGEARPEQRPRGAGRAVEGGRGGDGGAAGGRGDGLVNSRFLGEWD